MPRGTQFGALIDTFRDETGQANSRLLGKNKIDSIKALLRRTYRRLHTEFNWPHLLLQRDEVLKAGERYYTLPLDLDFDRLVGQPYVKQYGTDYWIPLRYGIDLHNLNSIDSDADRREDFPSYWEIYENDQFEVWPIPLTDGSIIRFEGIRRAKPLVNENETVDLDDDMIVLYAAAEQLARDRSPDADHKLQLARQHYLKLRGNTQKTNNVNMKVSRDREPQYEGIQITRAPR